MARPIAKRWVIHAELHTTEPLHVGGGATAGLDHVPFRDGAGRPTVPGTAVTGVLRHTLAEEPELASLFGDHEEHGASHLVVDDVHLTKGVSEEIRDGVGIDRQSGSAADGFKYDRVVLRPGASGEFTAHIDLPPGTETETQTKTARVGELLVDALGRTDLRIGAGTTRGLGGFEFRDLRVTEYQLDTPDGILALANRADGNPPPSTDDAPTGHSVRFTIGWEPVLPVAVQSGFPGNAVDHWPLTTVVDGGVRLLIPGSSIKGSLRSHLEHLVRVATGTQPTGSFLDQIHLPGPVLDLFGEAPRSTSDSRTGSAEWSPGRRGTLVFHDCTAKLGVTPEQWDQVRTIAGNPSDPELQRIDEADIPDDKKGKIRTSFEDATKLKHVVERLEKLGLGHLRPTQHVAIDRWRSVAADAKLFNRIEPVPCEALQWEPIQFELQVDRLESAARRTAVAAIALLLDELARGAVALGAGANRGMGSLRATSIRIDGLEPGALSDDATTDELPAAPSDASGDTKWTWNGETDPSPLVWLEEQLGSALWGQIVRTWRQALEPSSDGDSEHEQPGDEEVARDAD